MSLTSFLKIPAVRERFKHEWPLPASRPRTSTWPMMAPPVSARSPLIGTAFDYIVRFHLRRFNPVAEERDNWVAETAAGKLRGDVGETAQAICETSRARYQAFLQGEPLSDDLLASTVQLAQLDAVFRCGLLPPSGEFTAFEEDITDLRQLAEACDWSQWRVQERCRLNPTFGTASSIVGGADADFQLDTTLYELKTVRSAGMSSEHYHQLIGYTVLNFLDNGPPVEELAIYFSRFAQTVRWPAPDLSDAQHEPFLLWFCEAAHQAFGTGIFFSDIGVGTPLQSKLEAWAATAGVLVLTRSQPKKEKKGPKTATAKTRK